MVAVVNVGQVEARAHGGDLVPVQAQVVPRVAERSFEEVEAFPGDDAPQAVKKKAAPRKAVARKPAAKKAPAKKAAAKK